ncbi:MaoC family dehydratase N-terminal domain-containing protein [Streptomyces sp. NPDC004680]|uniref:FAS1-like dehydratase domain-containing protein n=1 Tax=Streptomyces sp. NPDC004680 TaxID=3154287 RepID=UPI0033A42602
MSSAPEHFAAVEADWRPEPVEATEFVTAAPVRALAGLFDQPVPALGVGDPLPPLWHWLYVLDRPAQADLGEDGHPRDGGHFLPPLPDRRRMFGGGRLEFRAPIRIGDLLTRRSEVARVRVRHGGSGWLLLATVRHEYVVHGEIRTVEEQDLVYRQTGGAPAPEPVGEAVPAAPTAVPGGPWSFTLRPDPTLLFRFSALTYNAHRIHYDRDYVRDVEGYPDLVVHGPLLALSLLELPRRWAPERAVTAFAFRSRAPLFAPRDIEVTGVPEGDRVVLSAGLPGAAPGMTASATLR